jgi:hypothetical protein
MPLRAASTAAWMRLSANRMSEQAGSAVPDAMTIESVEVREVAAHASRATAEGDVTRDQSG